MGDANHDRNHATHDSIYESEPSRDDEVITVGACFSICETVSVARRERSRGSALHCAAWSKTASNMSPSRTVFGVWIVRVCPWDAHSAPSCPRVADGFRSLHEPTAESGPSTSRQCFQQLAPQTILVGHPVNQHEVAFPSIRSWLNASWTSRPWPRKGTTKRQAGVCAERSREARPYLLTTQKPARAYQNAETASGLEGAFAWWTRGVLTGNALTTRWCFKVLSALLTEGLVAVHCFRK
jgi:hypothetical protein